MRAAVVERYGPPDVVTIREVPTPSPAPGEIRVRVHATTVSRTDAANLRGQPRFARIVTGRRGPKRSVLGVDFAGVVDAVGDGVARFDVGDRVFGIAPGGYGAHAEFLCTSAEGAVARLPDRVGFTDSVVCEGVWYAMSALDRLGLAAGHRILIYGASGAIGIAAVQLAKARGAEVIAVVDGRSLELMRSLGADAVVDYTAEDYTAVASDLDFVLDAVGKAHFREARRMLKPGGAFSATDFGPGAENVGHILASPFVRRRRFVFPLPYAPRPSVEVAAELFEAGALRTVVDRVLPFDAIVEAYRYVESGRKIGVVVLDLEPSGG
jgi:NADPH:quinone reductase-like Zn-dependent oxidoreductase